MNVFLWFLAFFKKHAKHNFDLFEILIWIDKLFSELLINHKTFECSSWQRMAVIQQKQCAHSFWKSKKNTTTKDFCITYPPFQAVAQFASIKHDMWSKKFYSKFFQKQCTPCFCWIMAIRCRVPTNVAPRNLCCHLNFLELFYRCTFVFFAVFVIVDTFNSACAKNHWKLNLGVSSIWQSGGVVCSNLCKNKFYFTFIYCLKCHK